MRRIRELARDRAARRAARAFIVEGEKATLQAIASGADIEAVYLAGEAASSLSEVSRKAAEAGIPVRVLARGAIARAADAVTPQPVLAVAKSLDVALEDVLAARFLLVLVDVNDPGNVGTILRIADAAGAGGVICARRTADVFNPKVVRASAGSLFSVPVVLEADFAGVLARLGRAGFRMLATSSRGGADYTAADFGEKTAFVFGNEAHGLSAPEAALVGETVTVPMAGAAESLNVASAAAVLCFEFARRIREENHSPRP